MSIEQLRFEMIESVAASAVRTSYRERLSVLLSGDLEFHGQSSSYASHDLHAFPAKFPPQLPKAFIEALTEPGEVVLDPMAGSGTAVVEALLAGRRGIAFDIDPLALRLCLAKVTPVPLQETAAAGEEVLRRAAVSLAEDRDGLCRELAARLGGEEREFADYWFLPTTQLELMALVREIDRVEDPQIREFLEVVFSSIIITKSGGVSLARDLAHTRPHRVQDKQPRPALAEYRKRLQRNLKSLATSKERLGMVAVLRGDAQNLALCDCSVDLIVTSPPYASNAIDYMRAHKFSLVWFGHSLKALSELRRTYIGHDAASGAELAGLPAYARQVVTALAEVDRKKAQTLHRYYSEMTRCLREMARVLKAGRAAIVVVGSSTMRGVDTRTDVCLAEIGKHAGLELAGIALRRLDRDRRMMPARRASSGERSQIEERMHEEYVIGFLKPEL